MRIQEEEATGALIIRCLGPFEVELGGEELRRLHSPKGLRVLAYLALDPGASVDKSLLAETLWPGQNSRENLDRTLRDLRRALGDPPRRPVRLCSTGHDRLQLQLQQADRIDAVVFQQMLQRGDAASLERAVDLYQGSLLDGWGSRAGEWWIDDLREEYRLRYVEALRRLRALALAERSYEAVQGYLRRELHAGENDETGWRELMRVFLENRDFERAAQVYHRFTASVSSASPAMRALWDQIPASERNATRERLLPDLPQFFTSLLGRQEALREILHRTATSPSRLMVLTGSGGVGKTRLAVALGRRRSGDFAQGVRFIDLTSATDPASVLAQVCSAFRVSDKQELFRALLPRELLLILDNCEQAQEACSDLAGELLETCSRLHILATSRHAFHIGELVWEVPGLALPPPSTPIAPPLAPEVLLRFSAIQLFCERAQAISQSFALTPTNAAAVVEICRRLDGLPLAIELAAIAIRMHTPEEIVARLADRFALLVRGRRNAQRRHQTLQAVIEWSYELLEEEEERRLFRRLSVFAGGWLGPAAIAACAEEGWGSTRIEELLEALVDKSLVVHSGESQSRFRMLESIQQYAADKLAADSLEERRYRRQHRDYFLHLVLKLNAEQSVQQQEQFLNTLDAEYHNLVQALLFCISLPEEVQEGLRLGAALQEFWWIRGYFGAGRAHLKTLLEHPAAQEQTQARAAALDGAGTLARMQGDYREARALHEEALRIFRERGLDRLVAYTLGNLGIAVWHQEEKLQAISLVAQSLEIHRRLENEEGIAFCLGNLGNMACEAGEYAAARSWMEECLQRMRAQGNAVGIANCLSNLGNIAYHQQDYASAYALHVEGLTIKRKPQDKLGIVLSLEALGDLACKEGQWERGMRLLGAEDRLREEIGAPKTPEAQAECDRHLTTAQQTLGEEPLCRIRAEGYAMPLDEAITYALRLL